VAARYAKKAISFAINANDLSQSARWIAPTCREEIVDLDPLFATGDFYQALLPAVSWLRLPASIRNIFRAPLRGWDAQVRIVL
jgi:hypothetical protein